jgi:hypothetical protein
MEKYYLTEVKWECEPDSSVSGLAPAPEALRTRYWNLLFDKMPGTSSLAVGLLASQQVIFLNYIHTG